MPSLKASIKIFSLFVLLVVRQYFLWVSPIIVVCVNNANIKGIHTMRGTESDHSHITMEVSNNIALLCIWISPCAPSSG